MQLVKVQFSSCQLFFLLRNTVLKTCPSMEWACQNSLNASFKVEKMFFFVSKKIPTRGPLVTPLVALFVPGVMGLHFKSIDAVTEKKNLLMDLRILQ